MIYTYRNKRAGAVVTVPCPVSGEWELVEEPKKDAEPVPEKKPVKRTVKRTAKRK